MLCKCLLAERINVVLTSHLNREETEVQSSEVANIRPRGGWLVMGLSVTWSLRMSPGTHPPPLATLPRSDKKPQQFRG